MLLKCRGRQASPSLGVPAKSEISWVGPDPLPAGHVWSAIETTHPDRRSRSYPPRL